MEFIHLPATRFILFLLSLDNWHRPFHPVISGFINGSSRKAAFQQGPILRILPAIVPGTFLRTRPALKNYPVPNLFTKMAGMASPKGRSGWMGISVQTGALRI